MLQLPALLYSGMYWNKPKISAEGGVLWVARALETLTGDSTGIPLVSNVSIQNMIENKVLHTRDDHINQHVGHGLILHCCPVSTGGVSCRTTA